MLWRYDKHDYYTTRSLHNSTGCSAHPYSIMPSWLWTYFTCYTLTLLQYLGDTTKYIVCTSGKLHIMYYHIIHSILCYNSSHTHIHGMLSMWTTILCVIVMIIMIIRSFIKMMSDMFATIGCHWMAISAQHFPHTKCVFRYISHSSRLRVRPFSHRFVSLLCQPLFAASAHTHTPFEQLQYAWEVWSVRLYGATACMNRKFLFVSDMQCDTMDTTIYYAMPLERTMSLWKSFQIDFQLKTTKSKLRTIYSFVTCVCVCGDSGTMWREEGEIITERLPSSAWHTVKYELCSVHAIVGVLVSPSAATHFSFSPVLFRCNFHFALSNYMRYKFTCC